MNDDKINALANALSTMSGPTSHYISETQVLRRVLANLRLRFIWTNHARKEMADDDISIADAIYVLTNGHVVLQENKKDILWRVEGQDTDGRKIAVVVAVSEQKIEIKAVTAFWIKPKGGRGRK